MPDLKQVGTGLQTAATPMFMIPGVGSIAGGIVGGLGLGMNLLDAILGRDKFDTKSWKNQQISNIEGYYNKAKQETKDSMQNLSDATLNTMSNKSGMAAGVAGMNNPARIQADITANVLGQRDQRIANAKLAFNQQEAGAKQQVEDKAAQIHYNQEANAPSWRDYAGNFMQTLQTPLGMQGLGAIVGGGMSVGKWIGNMFKNGISTAYPMTQKDNTNYTGMFNANIPQQQAPSYVNNPNLLGQVKQNSNPLDLSGGNLFLKRMMYPNQQIFNPNGINWNLGGM